MAVLQALNRAGGPFNDEDEQLLGIFTAQAGIALQNALLYRRSERASARVRSVLELVRNLQKDLNVNSLMFTITQVSCVNDPSRLSARRGALTHAPWPTPLQRAHSLVDADRCTLFLVDHQSHELTSLQVRGRTAAVPPRVCPLPTRSRATVGRSPAAPAARAR